MNNLQRKTAGTPGPIVRTAVHNITYMETEIFKILASIPMQIFIKKLSTKKRSLKMIRLTATLYKSVMIKD